MKYFIISIFYEEDNEIKHSLRKSYVVEAAEFPDMTILFEAKEYELKGYRRGGCTPPFKISKTTADALLTL